MNSEELEPQISEFIKDQQELQKQEDKLNNRVELLTNNITSDAIFDKSVDFLKKNNKIVKRAAMNNGTMQYDDVEELTKSIYKKGQFVPSDKLKNLYGVFSESELSKDFINDILYNFDAEIEDRGSIPNFDVYDYFLLKYDDYNYCFHWVKKGVSLDSHYIKMSDKSKLFDFPTYKNKPYFGLQF